MIEKAQRILDKLNRKNHKSMKPWSTRDRVLNEFNTSTLDDVGPVAGRDQELKVLKEMNDLQDLENEVWSRGCV